MDDKIIKQIKIHEGFKGNVYKCTEGKNTIGYGRNLDANPITEKEAEFLLLNDLKKVEQQVDDIFMCYESLNHARQAVLIDMCFNIGLTGLRRFVNMFMALDNEDFEKASREMLDSRWAKQVGYRALKLSKQMKTGEIQ